MYQIVQKFKDVKIAKRYRILSHHFINTVSSQEKFQGYWTILEIMSEKQKPILIEKKIVDLPKNENQQNSQNQLNGFSIHKLAIDRSRCIK